ncbi:MAG: hypothetical protein NTX31_02185, partial [Burkholderiales bacterium]|nr:hypothetical protein [Burkholderiales bacterium]
YRSSHYDYRSSHYDYRSSYDDYRSSYYDYRSSYYDHHRYHDHDDTAKDYLRTYLVSGHRRWRNPDGHQQSIWYGLLSGATCYRSDSELYSGKGRHRLYPDHR